MQTRSNPPGCGGGLEYHRDFRRQREGGPDVARDAHHFPRAAFQFHALPQRLAIRPDAPVAAAILEISRGGIGMTAVVDEQNRVVGIFTDGDVRRAFEKNLDLRALTTREVMTAKPRTIGPDKLAVEAVEMMEQFKINALPVTGTDGTLLGALNMHDLFRAKVI